MTAPGPPFQSGHAAELDYALVRTGTVYCALPHGDHAAGQRFVLRRIVPWCQPTPVPGVPSALVPGVAPLANDAGIERVEVIVDLAHALGIPASPHGKERCILLYEDQSVLVGISAGRLLRRVRLAEPAGNTTLPFSRGLVRTPTGQLHADGTPPDEWHVIDVDSLLMHVARLLGAPGYIA